MTEDSKAKSGKEPASMDGERLGRRLFFFRVATLLTGAAAVGTSHRARAQESDADTGPNADPPGKGKKGRSPRETVSNTDSDWGPNRDPVGGARRNTAPPVNEPGVTDSDSGPNADKPGKGKGKK
jgi:hypothetical protein